MFSLLTGRTGRSALALASLLAAGSARAETALRFTLDFRFEGPSAPFLLSLDKGYYKAEGLNVTLDPGARALEAIERVATGIWDMGVADLSAVIKYNDANPKTPVKAVFIVYNRPPFAVISRKSRGVTKPKDLEGKKLGAATIGSAFVQWPIFVQANGIDAGKITIENVGFPVREPMLAAGQVDAITGFSYITFISLKDRGVPPDDIVVMLMADHGVELYGNAIILNPKFGAEHPDAVKGFLRAFLIGLKDTVAAPAAAIDSVLKRYDGAKKPTELERLEMAIRDNIATPEVKKNGYGDVEAARMAKAIEQIGLTYKFKKKPKPADVFDTSFLPPATDLKF